MSADESHDDRTQSFVALTKGTEVSHYRIVEKIGSGGMGEVYLAQDTKLNRKVALKFLPPHLCQDEDCRKRFTREAQAAAKLSHPNIVAIHEVGEFNGRPFFVMDHIEGLSLRDVIKLGKLKIADAIKYTMQIAEGLHKAHESGVVHRDIKPSNIIIDTENRTRIVDFGLATVSGEKKLTKTGSTLGTVGYMSPEQVEGKHVDQRSDLFSVGIILYEMLTGRCPFEGDNDAAVAKAITDSTPEPIARYKSGTTGELQQVIDRALTKDASIRYQTASGILADLKRLEVGATARKRSWIGLWAVLTVVATVVIGYFLLNRFEIASKDDGSVWENSIAVLIFRNLSGEEDQDILCEGMTDEIIGRLSTVEKLKVTSMQSMLRFKETDLDLKTIGRELNVYNVLEGSIKQSGDRIRVRAQLIRVEDDAHIWADRYDRELGGIFDLQDDITRAIVDALEATLVGTDEAFASRRGTDNLDAYNACVRGRFFWRRRTDEDIRASIESFEEAIRLDSNYAAAWSGLADAWWALPEYGNTSEAVAYPKWEHAAAKAFGLDPNLAEARATKANVHRMKGEFEDSESEYLRAIELNPGYSWSHYWYSKLLEMQGRNDERRTHLQIAYELDPLSLPVLTSVAYDTYRAGDYEKTIEQCERVIELGGRSSFMYGKLIFAHLALGDTVLAVEIADRMISDQPDYWKFHDLKGQLMWRLRDHDKALDAYQTAVEVAPERWEPQNQLGRYKFRYLSRYEEAEVHFKKAIELDTLQASPHRQYAYLLQILSRTSEAEEHYQRAIELAPYDPDTHRYYGWFLGTVRREYHPALEHLNRAVQLNPWYSRSYNSLSWISALAGNYGRALWAIDKSIEVYPSNSFPYKRRSEILVLAGMLDSAGVSYEQYLSKEPLDETALGDLGDVYTVMRKYKQADSVYALLTAHPDSIVRTTAILKAVKTLRHQGRFREVLDRLSTRLKEIKAAPGSSAETDELHLWQGVILLLFLDDPKSALSEFDSAATYLDASPSKSLGQSADLDGLMAEAMALAGETESAEKKLQELIDQLDPSESQLVEIYSYHLATVYRTAGEFTRSVRLLEPIAERNPYFSNLLNIGRSYIGAGRINDAIVVLQKALSSYDGNRFYSIDEAVTAHYYLGQAYEAEGRHADAVEQYEIFLDIWKDADKGLKSVEDAKRRLANLKPEL